MRLPNGYGSVEKLNGNRRNPWRVRVTRSWDVDVDTGIVKQIRVTIGYYPSKKEAMQALAAYNETPWTINNFTLEDIYERWSDEHFQTISQSNISGYKAAWKVFEPIKHMKMNDIKLDHLQHAVDTSGKNRPTLRKVKSLVSQLFDYAIKHEYISVEKSKIPGYINIDKAGNPNGITRTPFTEPEIERLWNDTANDTTKIILMMIYSGVRISELLELKKENVNLELHCFNITEAKTKAGIRTVPIHDRTFPFFQRFMDDTTNTTDYLLHNSGNPWQYRNFYDSYWTPTMNQLNMEHRPHDTRHTCVSMLTAKGVDERIVKKIVGHAGNSVTQIVYTHVEIQQLLKEINKL